MISWKKLTLPFNKNIHDALKQQHHGAQFIALVGRHLIDQKSDDSNTNMTYRAKEESLLGNPMTNGLRVGLNLTDLHLYVHSDQQGSLGEIPLLGITKQEAFSQLKNILSKLGIEISKLKDQLHYEIPYHPVEKGAPFVIKDHIFFQESTFYRHNAEIILCDFAKEFKNADPVRVWPHHFDTGTYIPLKYNNKGGLSQSIGLGWSIPDGMVDEPYFYLSYWSENPVQNFDQLPTLESGQWISSGWQGGILKVSDILRFNTANEQSEQVKLFFNSGIKLLNSFLNKNSK